MTIEGKIFLSTRGQGISTARFESGRWSVKGGLPDTVVHCFAVDPHAAGRVYAGTRTRGVLRSDDAGETWSPIGLEAVPVKSLAVSPHDPSVIYAGAKPVSLYKTMDGGGAWKELPALRAKRRWWWFSPAEPPGLAPYVQAVSVSPGDPDVLLAGIELGAVLYSSDGGQHWTKHRRRAIRDCHSLKFHPTHPGWAYEGGAGGGGAAYSRDGGKTWSRPVQPAGSRYGWMVAADPDRPEVWYLSASRQPNLLRGEFTPPAHNDGSAGAVIYRCVGGAPLEPLSGGLPEPLDYMPYALVPDLKKPGHLFAGLANGDVWHTENHGDRWDRLPFNLGGIHREMVMLERPSR